MYPGDEASIVLAPGTFLCKYQTSWTFDLSPAYQLPAYATAVLGPKTVYAPLPDDPSCTWQPHGTLTIVDGGANSDGSTGVFEQYTDGGFGIFYFHAPDPNYDDGIEQLVAGSWLGFPWRQNARYLYFNMAHFWSQHLSCYLKSTQDEFMDQTNADFQTRIAAGTAPSSPGTGTFFDYTFNDRGTATPIRYKVGLPTGSVDWVVGTAYIPGKPNC